MLWQRSPELCPLIELLPLLLLSAAGRGEVRVESVVHGSARLPCRFPFIEGEENLLIIWEKAEDGGNVQVYKFLDGQSDLSNQDPRFRGRTNLSGNISQGNLDLTLSRVAMNDGGTYFCRAANKMNHGDNTAVLSVRAPPPEVMERAVDGNVTLVPKYSGVPSEIRWNVNNDILVEMDLVSPRPHFYRLADRAHLDPSGVLTIKNLTKEDSGVYRSEVVVTNIIQETEIRLFVLDRVSKPSISDFSSSEEIILRCESSTLDAAYKWRIGPSGETVSTTQDYRSPRSQEEEVLICIVNNKVSEDWTSITVLCTPETGGRHHFIIIIIPVMLAVILISAMMLHHRHRNFHDIFGEPARSGHVSRKNLT